MEVKRVDFEQVLEAQDELIFSETGIDVLMEKKETIDPKSRNIFFIRLAKALLGKGLDYPVNLAYNGGFYKLGSVSEFARKMAYFKDTPDKKQIIKARDQEIRIPIELLWKALREALYKPMDEALTLAFKSSMQAYGGSGDSYGLNPENKFEK